MTTARPNRATVWFTRHKTEYPSLAGLEVSVNESDKRTRRA
jgi:hypothetical protein